MQKVRNYMRLVPNCVLGLTVTLTQKGVQGNAPEVTLQTCDGRLQYKNSDKNPMNQDGVKTYTISNFRPHADNLMLETQVNLQADIDLQLCDDNGSNCSSDSVKRSDGADGTHQINGLVYIRNQDASWKG